MGIFPGCDPTAHAEGNSISAIHKTIGLDVGINVPTKIGMALEDVSTPTLIIDLDAFERNVK